MSVCREKACGETEMYLMQGLKVAAATSPKRRRDAQQPDTSSHDDLTHCPAFVCRLGLPTVGGEDVCVFFLK